MKRFKIILFLLAVLSLAQAQKPKAIKLYSKGISQYSQPIAEEYFMQSIAKDSAYVDPYIKLAEIYGATNRTDKQVALLQTASRKVKKRDYTSVWGRLAHAAYLNGNYEIAKEAIEELALLLDEKDENVEHLKASIEFSLNAIATPMDYEPKNLGEAVNTKFDDYWPALSIDGQELITTVRIDDKTASVANEDFYISQNSYGKWSDSKPLSKSINSDLNEGAQCISADGKVMLYTACDRGDGFGQCDIYIAFKRGGGWTPPVALPQPINSQWWDGHPSLSADGKQLYFSSNRKGSLGACDIYVASVDFDGGIKIGLVKNMGEKINTEEDEVSPFIHPDGKTLYFSSKGHLGLGRHDIFYTQKDKLGRFKTPKNFGYPINTHEDEIGLIVNTAGDRGYYASERDDSQRKDIYYFDLPEEVAPNLVTYFKAKVTEQKEGLPIKAKVELRNINTGKLLYTSKATSEFVIALPAGESYAINVAHPEYLFHSENIALETKVGAPYEKDIVLFPIKKGEALVLKNILFKTGSHELDSSYTDELDRVVSLMKENSDFDFEVSGHTDKTGSYDFNMKLSEKRALSVCEYLIANGVAFDRLTHKGYGYTKPISDDPNENRRTELLIK